MTSCVQRIPHWLRFLFLLYHRDKTSLHALQSMVPEDMFDYCHQAGLLEVVLLSGEDPTQVHRRAAHYHDYEGGRC